MGRHSLEEALEAARRDTEIILQTRFGLEHPEDTLRNSASKGVRQWKEILSTDPNKVSLHPEEARDFSVSLRNECFPVSRELGICHLEAGINVIQGSSRFVGAFHSSHKYLITERYGYEVLLDPTIAQIILGHNHVYVGTRDQLRKIVLYGIKPEGPFTGLWWPDLHNNPEKTFEAIWGSNARAEPFNLKTCFWDVTKMKINPLVT